MDVRLKLPDKNDIEIKENLRIMTLPTALISCAPGYSSNNVIEARAALTMISDASEILCLHSFLFYKDEEELAVKAFLGHFGRSKRKKEYKTIFQVFG